MHKNLEPALLWVLAHEGGYVNHPKDPGGATNMGVTQRVYDGYRKRKRLPVQSVRAIESSEVAEIYKSQYWDAVRGDDLPSGLDYAVFDYAVNSGPVRAIKDLQREVGVKDDGLLGQITLGAIKEQDVFDLIERLCNRRMAFLKRLKHWKTFGRGWTARVMGIHDGAQHEDIGVIDRAMRLATSNNATVVPAPSFISQGKAEEVDRDHIWQSSSLQMGVGQIATYGGAAWTAVTQMDGTDRTLVIALLGAAGLMTMWMMRERLRHWFEGVR